MPVFNHPRRASRSAAKHHTAVTRRQSRAATVRAVNLHMPAGPSLYPFLCPQCGCPTHGSATSSGQRSTYCEDCTSDRDIDDPEPLRATG